MSLLNLNYRGLGNFRTVNALEKVVNKEDPMIVFLMETKSYLEWMEFVKEKCKMRHGLVVSSNGRSGGLALLWREGVKVDVQTYSKDLIDAWVDGGPNVGWWHLMGFYGNPDTAKRGEFWAKMRHLSNTSTLPWLVIGDFHEFIGLSEKEEGGMRPRRQMEMFVEAIDYCGLRYVGFVGPKFTWRYTKQDGTQIRERLDRALATQEWLDLFPVVKLHVLSSSASNHAPLSLHLKNQPGRRKRKKLFWFESMWLKDQRCNEIVQKAWEEGELASSEWVLSNCLDTCRAKLSKWNKEVFWHVGKMVVELQSKLERLELIPTSPDQIRALRNTRIELNRWLDKEDEMWRQRSRINWL